MKLLTALTITLFTSTALFSQTTMCFKENHNSMSTIELTKLDGGECKSIYTASQMKENGWEIDDIKITTKEDKYSFIYIFKNKTQNTDILSQTNNITDLELEAKIMKRIEQKEIQKLKEDKIEKDIKAITNGKEVYLTSCMSCHGEKGELESMNSSRALNTLSYEEMQKSIDLYINDNEFGNGRAFVMRPYAARVSNDELKNISNYIKSINK